MDIDVTRIILIMLMIGGSWLVFKIPTSYMQGYIEWVHEKHGSMVIPTIGILIMAIGVGIVLMLTDPIKNSLIGTICGLVTGVLIVVFVWDNYSFWKSSFNSNRN